MGWNTSALFMSGATPSEATEFLTTTPAYEMGETVSYDVATSGRRADVLYAAHADGWAQVWEPSGRHVFGFIGRAELDVSVDVLAVLLSSVSSIYGFVWFDQGVLTRRVIYSEGVIADQFGDPIPAEASVAVADWGPDEDYIFSLIQAVTGQSIQDDQAYEGFRLES